MKPRVLILHVPGTNRDREAAWACERAGGNPEIAVMSELAKNPSSLKNAGMILLPGGFSYGDDLGAGRIWATALREQFGDALRRFVDDGKPVLGICNGFQALLKSGLLLPLDDSGEPLATLTRNQSAQFECRWVHLVADGGSNCLFTADLREPIECPVAHGEGRFVVRDQEALSTLQSQGLVALRYADANGEPTSEYPDNPNGSVDNIAGVCNPAGNVLGLMPHPEDHILPAQHPDSHRRADSHPKANSHSKGNGSRATKGLGLTLFEAGIRMAAN